MYVLVHFKEFETEFYVWSSYVFFVFADFAFIHKLIKVHLNAGKIDHLLSWAVQNWFS